MANGLVERTNQTLVRKLEIMAREKEIDWDEALPEATFAYNCCYQKLLNTCPFTALFLRQPRFTDIETSESIDPKELQKTIKDRINANKERIEKKQIHLPHADS